MNRYITLLLALIPCLIQAQDPVLDQAQAAYDRAELKLAMMLADSVVNGESASAKAYKLRGDIHQRMLAYDLAMLDYKKSESLDPSDARLYVSRSAARITEGNIKGALRDLEKAIELDPTDADAYYNRACANYLARDNSNALKDADKALKLRPDHADALFLSGVVQGEQYREAVGLADVMRALELKPTIPGGMMSAGVLLYELKRYEEAIEKFSEVIAQNVNEDDVRDAHFYRGDSYYELDNKEMACRDWRISAELGDKDSVFIVKNYCETDEKKIPKKPVRKRRRSVISF